MECYVTLEIVSEENFSALAGTMNAMRDGEMDVCHELLGELDEDALELFRALEAHHGEYLDALDDVSTDEEETRIRATFVTGSDGDDFLCELLMLFGPHSDLARGKLSDTDSRDEDIDESPSEVGFDDEESGLGGEEEIDDDEEDPFDSAGGTQMIFEKGHVIEDV